MCLLQDLDSRGDYCAAEICALEAVEEAGCFVELALLFDLQAQELDFFCGVIGGSVEVFDSGFCFFESAPVDEEPG